MNVIAAHLRLRAVSLFPYLDDWLIRDLIRNRLISRTKSNGTKSGFHTKSKEVRFDTNTRIHLFRYGLSNSTKNRVPVNQVKALILTIKTILSQTQVSA